MALDYRETLVVELTSSEQSCQKDKKVNDLSDFLIEASNILGFSVNNEQVKLHLSELYGYSGWVPLLNEQGSAAIHLYLWDDRNPPFYTFDFAASKDEIERSKNKLIEFTGNFFKAEKLSFKTLKNKQYWQELESTIVRQRLKIIAKCRVEITEEPLKVFFETLCENLNMVFLNMELDIMSKTAWQHWETSGCIVSWNREMFEIDIFTCKRFDKTTALRCVEQMIGSVIEYTEY